MKTQHNPIAIVHRLALFLALLLTLLPGVLHAAPPAQPAIFWGRVTIANQNVPENSPENSVVSIWRDGVLLKESPVELYEGATVYALIVPENDPATPAIDGGNEGALLTFKLNGEVTNYSATWHSGTTSEVNLRVEQSSAVLLSIAPNFGDAGSNAQVVLQGINTHFVNGTTVANFGSGITIDQLTVTSATEATAHLTLADSATPGPRTVTLTTSAEIVSLENSFTVRGPGLDISLTTATVVAGLPIVAAVVVNDDMSAQEIHSASGEITYDPAVLELVEVSQAGSLLAGWSLQTNLDNVGSILFAAYSATPLTGSGPLLYLRFNTIGAPGTTSPLTFERMTFNEGTPGTTPHHGQITLDGLGLGGRSQYRGNNLPVLNATLTLQAATTRQSTSNSGGEYAFALVGSANLLLTPSKSGDHAFAISALDAAWMSQCELNKRPASDCSPAFGDVSGDGTVTAYDASFIARHLVGIPHNTPIGQWQFDPPFRTYQPFDATKSGEHFLAWIMGDVTRNYTVEELLEVSAAGVPALYLAAAQPELDAAFTLPLALPSLNRADLYAFELTIHFDAARLKLDDVAAGASLGSGWDVLHNLTQPGEVKIVAYGVDALANADDLLHLHFTALAQAGETAVEVSSLRLNEERPLLKVTQSIVEVQATEPTAAPQRLHLPRIQS